MRKLQKVGFFESMPKVEAVAALNALRAAAARPNEADILRYLRGGTQAFVILGLSSDLLSPKREVIGPPNIFTDGEWVWPADLLYYIEKYHIDVPEAFVRRMEERGWHCPPVKELHELDFGLWQA